MTEIEIEPRRDLQIGPALPQKTASGFSNPLTVARIKQAVKTGIAGVVAMYVARWLKLPEGYWAVISALIVMQSNIGATVSASWNRLVSTAIGAAMGGLFATFSNGRPLWFGAAVALTVLICALLNLLESYRLAAVTVAIIMLIGRVSNPAIIALHRFIEVSVGIVVGVAVTAVIWPARAREHLSEGMIEVIHLLSALYAVVVRRTAGEKDGSFARLTTQLNAALRKNEGLLKEAVYEPNISRGAQELLPLFMQHLERIAGFIEGLEFNSRDGKGAGAYANFEPELDRLMRSIAAALELLAVTLKSGGAAGDNLWPDLRAGVSALDGKFASLRAAGEFRSFELDEVLRSYSFLLTLRSLADELDLCKHAMPFHRKVGDDLKE